VEHYDGIFIGGGPGGYEAALYARRFGKNVAIVEKSLLGGTCLHWGCIPTKTLLASAKKYLIAQLQEKYGLPKFESPVPFNWNVINARRKKVIEDNCRGLEKLIQSKNITVHYGEGAFVDPHTICVAPKEAKPYSISGDKIFIATGSYPVPVPGTEWHDDWMIPGEDCLGWEKLPESILIVGAGVMGCEFACTFAPFGVEVHIVEVLDNALPSEDIEVSKTIRRELKKLGVNVYLGKKLQSFTKTGPKVIATIENTGDIEVDHILICAGRKGIVKNLNLDAASVALNDHCSIAVDKHQKTNVDHIYAFGDVSGPPLLAHSASYEGKIAACHAFTGKGERDLKAIPAGIFTIPEVGRVGLTEKQCCDMGINYRYKISHYRQVGRSHADGDTSGFAKIIVDEKDKIIGSHIVGDQAAEIVHVLALAMSMELTSRQFEDYMIFSHPTLSEVIWEALKELNA
jgi:dihydrolipoamide dehydrogenase